MSKVKIESEDCHCENCLLHAGMLEMVRLGQLSERYKRGELTSDEMALTMCLGVLSHMIVALNLLPEQVLDALFEGVNKAYDAKYENPEYVNKLIDAKPMGSC